MARVNGSTRGYGASKDGIEAASKTYIKCMRAIAEAADIEPVIGGAPRESFEHTVTKLRAILVNSTTGAKKADRLTIDDFSFNEVLRLMRDAALGMAGERSQRIERDTFIREALRVIREDGGLEKKKIYPDASTGHYAWVVDHMPTFLRRNRDAIKTVAGSDDLRVAKKPAPRKTSRKAAAAAPTAKSSTGRRAMKLRG